MNLRRRFDEKISPLGKSLQEDYMSRWGIANSRRFSKFVNRWHYASRRRMHREAARNSLAELLAENRSVHAEPESPAAIRIEDGWAIDRGRTLPFLDRLLAETGPIIEKRGGREHSDIQQPYFRSLLFPGDDRENLSFYDFALSSTILEPIVDYMGTIPVLSRTRPPGLRMMESNAGLDDRIDPPLGASQLFHLDLHDSPLVYVVVLLDEVTEECGPWSFLPASVSDRAQRAMEYQKRGVPYRIPDEMMYEHVDPDDLIVFTGQPGDVLFIDSSRCFHYGSRQAIRPRFLMMYGYTTPFRADLTMAYLDHYPYPVAPGDSRLRRLLLDPQD